MATLNEISIQQHPGIVLDTERLELRELTNDIMRQVLTSMADAEIKEYLGIQTETELERERNNFEKGYSWYRSMARNFIVVDKQSGRTLGRIGFHTWYEAHSRAEVGYHIARDEDKRKGIMKEALVRLIAHSFEDMKLNRIEAFVGPGNIASQLLLRGQGFIEEGMLRGHYYKNGVAEDSLCFGLLRSEWRV